MSTAEVEVQNRTVLQISLRDVIPSPTNPRQFADEKNKALEELADSIKRHGIMQPLTVMQGYDETAGKLIIISGERRFHAAKLANLDSVPVIVRDVTATQAREMQIVENLQRADVHPLMEAEGYYQLIPEELRPDRTSIHVLSFAPGVAKSVGKGIAYVTQRLKLLTLTEESRRAYGEGIITLDHALLLAKLAFAEQNAALKWCVNPNAGAKAKVTDVIDEFLKLRKAADKERAAEKKRGGGYSEHPRESKSVAELRVHIENDRVISLKEAPWKLEDADLVAVAGACTDCPKRTGANPALFADLAVAESSCTDGACYRAKLDAFVQIQLGKAASKKGATSVVRLSYKASTTVPQGKPPAEGKPDTRTYRFGQFETAKAGSCPNVVAGVFVDAPKNQHWEKKEGKGGETLLVCVTPKCKVHKKGYERPSGSSGGGSSDNQERYRRQEAERAEKCKAEMEIRGKILAAVLEKQTTITPELQKLMIEGVIRGARSYGDGAVLLESLLGKNWDDFDKLTKPKAVAQSVVGAIICQTLSLYGNADQGRKEFLEITAALGVDGSKFYPKPEPKAKKKGKAKAAKSGK